MQGTFSVTLSCLIAVTKVNGEIAEQAAGMLIIIIIMLSLTSVSASEVVIGDVAHEFKLPFQRVHAVTVTVAVRRIRTDAG